jgi:ketosteroid isomerase-like protein
VSAWRLKRHPRIARARRLGVSQKSHHHHDDTARRQADERAGYTLTILRKQANGQWLLSRDANLLTEVKD